MQPTPLPSQYPLLQQGQRQQQQNAPAGMEQSRPFTRAAMSSIHLEAIGDGRFSSQKVDSAHMMLSGTSSLKASAAPFIPSYCSNSVPPSAVIGAVCNFHSSGYPGPGPGQQVMAFAQPNLIETGLAKASQSPTPGTDNGPVTWAVAPSVGFNGGSGRSGEIENHRGVDGYPVSRDGLESAPDPPTEPLPLCADTHYDKPILRQIPRPPPPRLIRCGRQDSFYYARDFAVGEPPSGPQASSKGSRGGRGRMTEDRGIGMPQTNNYTHFPKGGGRPPSARDGNWRTTTNDLCQQHPHNFRQRQHHFDQPQHQFDDRKTENSFGRRPENCASNQTFERPSPKNREDSSQDLTTSKNTSQVPPAVETAVTPPPNQRGSLPGQEECGEEIEFREGVHKGEEKKKLFPNKRKGKGGVRSLHPEELFEFSRYEAPVINYPRSKRGAGGESSSVPLPFVRGRHVQASHRLLVEPGVDLAPYKERADALLDWDVVRIVEVICHSAPECPICLQDAIVVPRITRCGHIFCLPCFSRLVRPQASASIIDGLAGALSLAVSCPVCSESTSLGDLRPCRLQLVQTVRENAVVDLVLIEKRKVPSMTINLASPIFRHYYLDNLPTALIPCLRQLCKLSLVDAAEEAMLMSAEQRALVSAYFDADEADEKSLIVACLQTFYREDVEGTSVANMTREEEEFYVFSYLNDETDSGCATRSAIDNYVIYNPEELLERLAAEEAVAKESRNNARAKEAQQQKEENKDESQLEGIAVAEEKESAGTKGLPTRNKTSITSEPKSSEIAAASAANKNPSAFGKDTDVVTTNGPSFFYQAADGQLLFADELTYRCLLHEAGGDATKLPRVLHKVRVRHVGNRVVDFEFRKRYRLLGHIPLSASLGLLELDVRGLISPSTWAEFRGPFETRHNHRRRERQLAEIAKMRAGQQAAFPTFDRRFLLELRQWVPEVKPTEMNSQIVFPSLAPSRPTPQTDSGQGANDSEGIREETHSTDGAAAAAADIESAGGEKVLEVPPSFADMLLQKHPQALEVEGVPEEQGSPYSFVAEQFPSLAGPSAARRLEAVGSAQPLSKARTPAVTTTTTRAPAAIKGGGRVLLVNDSYSSADSSTLRDTSGSERTKQTTRRRQALHEPEPQGRLAKLLLSSGRGTPALATQTAIQGRMGDAREMRQTGRSRLQSEELPIDEEAATYLKMTDDGGTLELQLGDLLDTEFKKLAEQQQRQQLVDSQGGAVTTKGGTSKKNKVGRKIIISGGGNNARLH